MEPSDRPKVTRVIGNSMSFVLPLKSASGVFVSVEINSSPGRQQQLDRIDVALTVGLHSTQLRLTVQPLGVQYAHISGIPGDIRLPRERQRGAGGFQRALLCAQGV